MFRKANVYCIIPGNSYADYGTVLIGILVMQDVLLGVLIALLPTLAGQGADLAGHSQQELVIFYMLFGLKLAASKYILPL